MKLQQVRRMEKIVKLNLNPFIGSGVCAMQKYLLGSFFRLYIGIQKHGFRISMLILKGNTLLYKPK